MHYPHGGYFGTALIHAINSGDWYDAPGLTVPATLSTGQPTFQKTYYYGFSLAKQATLAGLSIRVSTAGAATSVVRGGLYAGDGVPSGAALNDFGTVDTTTTGVKGTTTAQWSGGAISVALYPGRMYWAAINNQVVACSLNLADYYNVWVGVDSGTAPAAAAFTADPAEFGIYTQVSVAGALPSVGTLAKDGLNVPRVLLRFT